MNQSPQGLLSSNIGAPLTTFGGSGQIQDKYMNKKIFLESYLEKAELNHKTKTAIRRTAHATGTVFQGTERIANALLIADNLVLVNAHTFKANNTIQFQNRQKTASRILFDGRYDSHIPTDMMVIQIPSIIDRDAAELSVCTGYYGRSLQISHCLIGQNQGRQYVKVYETEACQFAQRSEVIGTTTQAGECGSPRMNLECCAVSSLHQGDREGFTINQMIHTLQRAKAVKKEISDIILSKLTIVDMQYFLMESSTISLNPGAVTEEVRQPSRVSFEEFLMSKTRDGVTRDGRIKYTIKINHLMRYLGAFGDNHIKKIARNFVTKQGLPSTTDTIEDLTFFMSFTAIDIIPNRATPTTTLSQDFQETEEKYKAIFKDLFKLCHIVSDGQLIKGLQEFVDPNFATSIYTNISQKFYTDHIVDFPSTSALQKNLKDKAKRRGIPVETALSERDRSKFQAEIAKIKFDDHFDRIYNFAHTTDKAINILFETQATYLLYEARRQSNGSYTLSEKTDRFLYTVEKKNHEYQVYHFESSKSDFDTRGKTVITIGSQKIVLKEVEVPFS